MINIYSAAYNISTFGFNYEKNIKNWCNFVGADGAVIIAVNTSYDNTFELLKNLQEKFLNLKLIQTDISYSNNRIDGLTKTAALNECNLPIRILMDIDEYFYKPTEHLWYEAARLLLESNYDGLLIPSIDLWGGIKYIRKHSQIGQKFRIHKDTIKSRGVIKQAELPGGYFNTSMSDCTEALKDNSDLGKFAQIVPYEYLKPENSKYLSSYPITIHESYLDLARKADHGKRYWKQIWENYSNKTENVATDIKDLENVEVIEHGLDISKE